MEKQSTYKSFDYCDLDRIDYKEAWDLQRTVFESRVKNEVDDVLFLLEHPHTYTLGKTADKNNLVYSEKELKEKSISVYDIDRGGDITYHGPGQVVGYPIIDLKNWKQDLHLYMRSLEEVIIRTCSEYGLQTGRNEKYTGVWVEDRKICAMGLKVRKWVTMHGFAFNINSQLEYFNGIIPCGIKEKDVTSLSRELNREIDLNEVKSKITKNFAEVFGYDEINEVDNEEFLLHA